MTLKYNIMLSILLCIVFHAVIAQSDSADRFSISICGGFSFPVGSYANSNADQSAIFNDGSDPYLFLLGFAKSQNGFATIGKYYNVELKYKVLKSWQLVFLAGNSINPVHKVPISDYMSNYISDLYNSETAVTITHSDYGVRYLIPGIGYTFDRKGLIMEMGMLCGYAKSDCPSYRSYFNSHPPQYEYYGDDKSHPDPSAFIWGINGSAKYVSLSKCLSVQKSLI